MKECKTCKKILDESLFPIARTDKKTGKIFYKNDCKQCKNKRDREKRKTVTSNNLMVNCNPPENISTNSTKNILLDHPKNNDTIIDNNVMVRLNTVENEIKNLKDFIKANAITNNNLMVNYDFDKKNRVKATYNIDKDIKDRLDKHCKEFLVNNSDLVNIALLDFLNKHRKE